MLHTRLVFLIMKLLGGICNSTRLLLQIAIISLRLMSGSEPWTLGYGFDMRWACQYQGDDVLESVTIEL